MNLNKDSWRGLMGSGPRIFLPENFHSLTRSPRLKNFVRLSVNPLCKSKTHHDRPTAILVENIEAGAHRDRQNRIEVEQGHTAVEHNSPGGKNIRH